MHLAVPIIILVTLLAILFVTVLVTKLARGRAASPNETASIYEAQKCLLTPAEHSFFGVLEQALGNNYRIFAKVRLADIIRPVNGGSRSGFQAALNRITSKHIDFLICDPKSFTVVGAVELDDKSHERFERGVRDNFVNTVLRQAKIPIIRIRARSTYSATGLRDEIFQALVR